MSTAVKVPLSAKASSPEWLAEKAAWVREQTLLIHRNAPETRIASSLSPVEICTALYYGGVVAFEPSNPGWSGRDRVIISKGHGSLCMYPILADLGYFPMSELSRVCAPGSFLGGIPDPIVPGYETVNGSLGHGVGVAAGIALSLRSRGHAQNVFALTGDGELHEGSVWEGFLFAAHHGLDNLTVIVDRNKNCMLGATEGILAIEPLAAKFTSFGFEVREVDGHDVASVRDALVDSKARRTGRPKALIAQTIKGKGVPQLESNPLCHVTGLKPTEVDEVLKRRPS